MFPRLPHPMERKNRIVKACDLGDCCVASSVVMSTPSDRFSRQKKVEAPSKPIRHMKRSFSLGSISKLRPVDSFMLSPKALELLGNLSQNNADTKALQLQECAGVVAAQGCHNCPMHSDSPVSSNDVEIRSPNRQEIKSASEAQRPGSTRKDSLQLEDDGEVETRPLSRKDRIEAFEAERRRSSHKHNSQVVKLLKAQAAQARSSSADQHASDANRRTERMEAFEAKRRRNSHKHDKDLAKLLKVHGAQVEACSPDQHASAAKRRVEYGVWRQEEIKRRKASAQEAKEFIRQCLVQLRVPADLAQGVVGMSLLKAGLDGFGGIEKAVTMDMVVESFKKAKADLYQSKMEVLVAQKAKSSEMGGTLRELILKSSAPWNWLSFLRSNVADDILSNSSSSAEFIKNVTDSPSLTCSICADSMFSVSEDGSSVDCNFWNIASRKNEHWNNHACGHTFCRSCAERWTETAINEQRLQIRCPAPGCKYRLWDQDLKELVDSKMFLRHQEHLHADHLTSIGLAKEDDSLMAWLRQHARPCPDCHVIVSRSEGCNTMVCVCGTKFCYACGFKTCKCGVKGRSDIWEIKA